MDKGDGGRQVAVESIPLTLLDWVIWHCGHQLPSLGQTISKLQLPFHTVFFFFFFFYFFFPSPRTVNKSKYP